MRFDTRLTVQSSGLMLGHGVKAKDISFRKGHWLSLEDIAALSAAGVKTVFAGEREPDDVMENDAALAAAHTIAGTHVALEAPHTGRCNLTADSDGLLVYAREDVIGFNTVDDRITLALAPRYTPVRRGDLIGTIKIIPFAVPKDRLDAALASVSADALARIAPYRPCPALLLETRLSQIKPLSQKVLEITKARASHAGLSLEAASYCDHDKDAVAAWIKATVDRRSARQILLIFGASATVDPADVIPAGIRAAGGTVDRVGMAADPGNLLVYGRLGEAHIIGLPGCAKSPALNGFDWVLERTAADLAITPADWAEMGVGGLLKEINSRPQLRQPKS